MFFLRWALFLAHVATSRNRFNFGFWKAYTSNRGFSRCLYFAGRRGRSARFISILHTWGGLFTWRRTAVGEVLTNASIILQPNRIIDPYDTRGGAEGGSGYKKLG